MSQTLFSVNERLPALGLPPLSVRMLMEERVWDKMVHWTDEDSIAAGCLQDMSFRLKTIIDMISICSQTVMMHMGNYPQETIVNIGYIDRKASEGVMSTATIRVQNGNNSMTVSFP